MVDDTLIDGLTGYAAAVRPEAHNRGGAALLRLRGVAQALGAASGPLHRRLGIDAGGLDVLASLRVAPSPHRLRPTALYRLLAISSGGLTARLNRLELAGLVCRSAAADDRRSSWVALTDQGRKLAEQALDEEIALRARIAEALSEREQWVLGALLGKLEARLAEPVAPPPGAA